MEFGTKVSKRLSGPLKDIEVYNSCDARALYPTALQMFKLPPMGEISLEEFNDFAIERLQALRIVENVGFKGQKYSKEYRELMQAELRKQKLMAFLRKTPLLQEDEKMEDLQDRKKDHVSHYILRLAFCRSEELRRWFIAQEVDLFRYRYRNESPIVISSFLVNNNLNYTQVTDEEKSSLAAELLNSSHEFTETELSIKETYYFKIKFLDALDLVRDRKVYVKNGYAYVPFKELSSIIVALFRQDLSRDLTVMSRKLPLIEEDRRLFDTINNLHFAYTGNDYASGETLTGSEVTKNMIDDLSRKHFPLCMRQLHNALRKDHHLKHGGRQQYGLFLKGIGLSLEQALQFWREELGRTIGIEKFEKQYSYNIRHNYGKEGKRANYTPYSCMKIIMSNPPGPGDNHGCFFRHNDAPAISQKLQQYKLPYPVLKEIKDLTAKGHCQVACTRFLEASAGKKILQAISHPNQYFEESRQPTVEVPTPSTPICDLPTVDAKPETAFPDFPDKIQTAMIDKKSKLSVRFNQRLK